MSKNDNNKPEFSSKTCTDKRRVIILAFAGLLFLLAFVITFPDAVETYRYTVLEQNKSDMLPYYLGGYMLAAGNPGVYDKESYNTFYKDFDFAREIHEMLNYPPFIYVIFSLFAGLNYSTVDAIWYFLSQLFMVLSVVFIFLAVERFYGSTKKWGGYLRIIIYLMIGFAFSPHLETLIQGQVNALLLMLISLSLYFHARDNETGAGMAAGLAAAIKLTPGILLIFFITRKRYRAFFSLGLTIVGVYLLIALAWGPRLIIDYFKHTPGGYTQFITLYTINNQGIPAFIGRLFKINGTSQPIANLPWLVWPLIIGVLSVVMAGLVYFGIRQKRYKAEGSYDPLLFSLYVSAIFIFSPLVWGHHLIYFIINIILVIEYFIRTDKITRGQFALGALLITFLAFTGTFNGRIPTATRFTMAYLRMWSAKSMINQFLNLLIWFCQGALLFLLAGRDNVPEKVEGEDG